jgi:hypothetical protein
MSGTAIYILVGAIPAVLGLVAWFTLLVWGARKDGEFQHKHDSAAHP